MTHHFYSCDDFFSLIKGSLVLLLLGNNSEIALGWSEGWRVSGLWGSVKGWLQLDSTRGGVGKLVLMTGWCWPVGTTLETTGFPPSVGSSKKILV